MSKFIVFEGVDKSGKSTQILKVEEWLKEKGYNVIRVCEPGYTELGKRLREILKSRDIECCNKAQELLFMAARAQLISEQLKPALIDNKDPKTFVLCDRYALSTLCYQVIPNKIKECFESPCQTFTRKVSIQVVCYETYLSNYKELCRQLNFITHEELCMGGGGSTVIEFPRKPDLYLVFDLNYNEWERRMIKSGEKPDRFERNIEYIRQVIDNYRFVYEFTTYKEQEDYYGAITDTYGHCALIDANAPETIVTTDVRQAILKRFFK